MSTTESWGVVRERNQLRCRHIVESAAPLQIDDLDWASVGTTVTADEVIASLVYMRDVEGFTDRDLVGLTAHRNTLRDPMIRRFLDIWRSEEAGHTAAIERYLQTYARARCLAIPARQLPPPATAPLRERAIAHIGGPVGAVVTAAHMAWARQTSC